MLWNSSTVPRATHNSVRADAADETALGIGKRKRRREKKRRRGRTGLSSVTSSFRVGSLTQTHTDV